MIKILIIFSSTCLCHIRNEKYHQEIDLTDTNVARSPVHQTAPAVLPQQA